jgi:signal peptidase I
MNKLGLPEAVPPTAASILLPRPNRLPRDLFEHLQFCLVALTIALFVITFVVQAFRIPSGSMENTLLVGDYLLVDKTRFGLAGAWQSLLPYQAIRRGDIIVFHYPEDPAQHFVKRVIGLGGDRLRLRHGHVYIDGRALTEPYAVFKEPAPDPFRDDFPGGDWRDEDVNRAWAAQSRTLIKNGELTVPRDCYFVLGDNRDLSLDSRYWGFVPRQNITGRPLLIYFSRVEAEDDAGDDDEPVASGPADDKLFTLRARISHVLGEVRWRRILRLAP